MNAMNSLFNQSIFFFRCILALYLTLSTSSCDVKRTVSVDGVYYSRISPHDIFYLNLSRNGDFTFNHDRIYAGLFNIAISTGQWTYDESHGKVILKPMDFNQIPISICEQIDTAIIGSMVIVKNVDKSSSLSSAMVEINGLPRLLTMDTLYENNHISSLRIRVESNNKPEHIDLGFKNIVYSSIYINNNIDANVFIIEPFFMLDDNMARLVTMDHTVLPITTDGRFKFSEFILQRSRIKTPPIFNLNKTEQFR